MSIFDKIHDELFESDPKDKPVVKPVVAAPAPVAASPSPITPYNFGSDTTTAPVSVSPSVPVYAPSTGAAINPDAMKAVTDGVFTPINGRPSLYLAFSKICARGNSPQMALANMQDMDSTITAQRILDDISTHLSLLEQVTASADATFTRAATERLGGADQKIKDLTALNEQAQAEIARHQKETGERIGQISQLQNDRATDEAQISQAKAAAIAAEGVVKAQLMSAQTILSTIQ